MTIADSMNIDFDPVPKLLIELWKASVGNELHNLIPDWINLQCTAMPFI